MGLEAERVAHAEYAWALDEVHRVIGLPQFSRVRSGNRKLKPYRYMPEQAWLDMYEVYPHHGFSVKMAVIRHVARCYEIAISHRSRRKEVNHDSIIDRAMDGAAAKARDMLEHVKKKTDRQIKVICAPGGVKVYSSSKGRELYISPLWKQRVHDEGIALPELPGRGQCFTMWARRKQSAFLQEEGIRAYDAKVYIPGSEARMAEGFIFLSDGVNCLFHEDFMRGANLIRRRVRDLVLDTLLGEEKCE